MEGELAIRAVMIVMVVALCGAVPTTSPSQQELTKAQVNMSCLFVLFNLVISGREEHSVFLCDSV